MIHNTAYAVSMTRKKYIEKMPLNFLMKKAPVFVDEASPHGVADIFILKQSLMRIWKFWSDTLLHSSK